MTESTPTGLRLWCAGLSSLLKSPMLYAPSISISTSRCIMHPHSHSHDQAHARAWSRQIDRQTKMRNEKIKKNKIKELNTSTHGGMNKRETESDGSSSGLNTMVWLAVYFCHNRYWVSGAMWWHIGTWHQSDLRNVRRQCHQPRTSYNRAHSVPSCSPSKAYFYSYECRGNVHTFRPPYSQIVLGNLKKHKRKRAGEGSIEIAGNGWWCCRKIGLGVLSIDVVVIGQFSEIDPGIAPASASEIKKTHKHTDTHPPAPPRPQLPSTPSCMPA